MALPQSSPNSLAWQRRQHHECELAPPHHHTGRCGVRRHSAHLCGGTQRCTLPQTPPPEGRHSGCVDVRDDSLPCCILLYSVVFVVFVLHCFKMFTSFLPCCILLYLYFTISKCLLLALLYSIVSVLHLHYFKRPHFNLHGFFKVFLWF